MARLPTAEQLGERPTPQVRGGISRLQLETPRMGQEAIALAEFGKTVAGLGDTLSALAKKEKEELDSARIEESTTEYLNGLLNYELGPDEGFVNITGGDAVKQPLNEMYRDKREALGKAIRERLGNDDQKTAFDSRMQIADRQFDARLYRHISEQARDYQVNVSEGVKATERQMAALNWQQPGQIEMSILRTNMEIERKARLDGFDVSRPEDAKVVETLKQISETQIHSDVVQQMILQGNDAAASMYYERVKSRLTPEAIVTLGSKVHESSIEGEAVRGADIVWQTMGPQGLNDPVRLDVMEQFVRDKYRNDPQTMGAAIRDLRSRAVAHNDTKQQMTASFKAKILDAYHQGADLKQLQTMPEYWELDGEERMKLRDYITDSGWTDQQRARQQQSYTDGAKASAGFQRYWELSNPRVLSIMSEQQILALEPELGQTLTEQLMVSKRKLSSPEKVMAATIDTEQFNVLAAEAGLNPYETKGQSAEQKEYLGRLRNQVETVIDVTQQQTGRQLTRQEKQEIMQNEIDRKVMHDTWNTSEKSMPAATVRPEQRQNVFVPLAEIDSNWMLEAANYMRSVGAVPQEWSLDDIKKKARGRLERAYATEITGGSRDEVSKILENK